MVDNKSMLINLFYTHGKNIPGIYDLILRGSASAQNKTKVFVKDWSDLDFSIIVEKIDQQVRDKVKNLYSLLKQYTDMKITITLVDKEEFFSKYHFHGIRPLTYALAIANSESLLRKETDYARRNFRDNTHYKLSSYFYLSYLIHELRNRYTACGNDITEVRDFFRHLIKRSNHILWNAIFLKTSYIGEDICGRRLQQEYPMLNDKFFQKIKQIRNNWPEVKEDLQSMKELTEFVWNNLEEMYKEINRYANNSMSDEGLNFV